MSDSPQEAIALLFLGQGEETTEHAGGIGIEDGSVLMKSKT